MSSPRIRFTLMVGALVVAWWLYAMVDAYLLGARGLNFARYAYGVLMIGSATACGFLLVWAAVVASRHAGRHSSDRTESLLAAPDWHGLHPLEAELIGFLNAYRHWPLELAQGDVSIYRWAMGRWEAATALPGSPLRVRLAALAEALPKIQQLREIRVSPPWWKLGERDHVRFQAVAPSPEDSAALLTALPAFKELPRNDQLALLTLLRSTAEDTPLPEDTPQDVRDVQRQLADITPTPAATLGTLRDDQRAQLEEALLAGHWLEEATPMPDGTEGCIALGNGRLLWRIDGVMGAVARHLPDELARALRLHAHNGPAHPAWPLVRDILLRQDILENTWYGHAAGAYGGFMFRLEHGLFGPAVVVAPSPSLAFDAQSQYHGIVLLPLDATEGKRHLTAQARRLDQRLAEIG
ncbi:MAG: hypothetical protein H6922_05635 [Pseudomonadaceae bacterium]|nr:hypothetical protein [Pseudomonadaceae bacterium]